MWRWFLATVVAGEEVFSSLLQSSSHGGFERKSQVQVEDVNEKYEKNHVFQSKTLCFAQCL